MNEETLAVVLLLVIINNVCTQYINKRLNIPSVYIKVPSVYIMHYIKVPLVNYIKLRVYGMYL